MALTINDKKFIANLLDQKLDHQEQKFEAKIIQIKSDFFDKVDPILKEVVYNADADAKCY